MSDTRREDESRDRGERWYQPIYDFFVTQQREPRWRRIATCIGVAGVVALGALLLVVGWQVSNANSFCSGVCHDVMYPYVAVWEHSTHVKVDCVECHMGRTSVLDRLPRKFTHVRELYSLIVGYETPLEATTLRPARVTCELCHHPEQFHRDNVVELRQYANDRDNTMVSTWLISKIGGGLEREGLGYGIHWHVEQEIHFYTSDDDEQEIPWMRIENGGEPIVYKSVDFVPPEGFPDGEELHLMDCMDCHNRVGHQMLGPEEVVDGALQRDQISAEIPYIRREAVSVLGGEYETTDEALEAIASLDQWYAENYSIAYPVLEDELQQAIEVLQDLYQRNFFPEKGYDWQTYAGYDGHTYWPGCFRCHDGKHVNGGNEVIRIECNLCHSIPEVVRGVGAPVMSLAKGPEPESHRDTAWLHRHRNEFDETCKLCHTVGTPGGTDNSSFCANSACHGVEWVYADLDAPGLAEQLGLDISPAPEAELTPESELSYQASIGPFLVDRCGECHGIAAELNVTTYASLMEGSERGQVIVPGEPEESPLVQILEEDHFVSIGETEVDLVAQWIEAGAPER